MNWENGTIYIYYGNTVELAKIDTGGDIINSEVSYFPFAEL